MVIAIIIMTIITITTVKNATMHTTIMEVIITSTLQLLHHNKSNKLQIPIVAFVARLGQPSNAHNAKRPSIVEEIARLITGKSTRRTANQLRE